MKGFIVTEKVVPVEVTHELENGFMVRLPDGQEVKVARVYSHLQDAFNAYKENLI